MKELGVQLTDVTAEMLGRAKSVKISKDDTTIVGGAGSKEAIDERIAQIKAEYDVTTSDFDKEKLQERLAKLAGGVAVIKVGAATEVELKEIKHRIEDALQATRAAVEEGIVAGGGVAFLEASKVLDGVETVDSDEKIGVEIVRKALEAPVKTIANNAGFEGSVVAEKIKGLDAGQGLDSATGEYGDMIEMGVLDPVKVCRVTLQNAASVASLILITEATVSDEPKNTTIEEAISAAAAQGGQEGAGALEARLVPLPMDGVDGGQCFFVGHHERLPVWKPRAAAIRAWLASSARTKAHSAAASTSALGMRAASTAQA